jgi:hypothetical protein
MNTAEASNLVNKIPKFSGQKEEIQLEEFVRQIENFADLVQLTVNEDSENEEICYLFKRLLTGKADQIWRMIKEEEEINLNIWKNVKSQFQQHFPAKYRTTIVKEKSRVHLKMNKNCLGSFQVLWNKNCTTKKKFFLT